MFTVYKSYMLVVYDYSDKEYSTFEKPCNVIIDEKKITLEFVIEGKECKWEGREKAPGHYFMWDESVSDVRCHPGVKTGTLHRMPDSDVLEGRWREDGCKGFWEITLGDMEVKNA
jgi:hypothetical protein